jgi:Domain of unknown function (DUF4352)
MKKVFKFGCMGFIVLIVLGIIVGALSGGDSDTASTDSTETKSEVKDNKKEEKKAHAIGDEVTVGKLTYTVNGVEETDTLSSVLGDKQSSGKYVVVDLTLKNGDKKSRFVDGEMFRIIGSDGTEFSSDAELDMYVNEDVGFFLEEVNPKMDKTGKVVFELPAEETGYNLQVSSGFGWSGGKYEVINLGK